MNARQLWVGALTATLAMSAGPARAERPLGVEVWTDRGQDAVYQPGDRLEVKARASDDGYLLVYEIDAEGSVHLLYPYRGSNGFVEGRRTYEVPPENSRVDLVVSDPTGQCFVVAIASREPFGDLPWYLRPYDMQAEEVGYEGGPDEEEGVTKEGRIVGDPYVAMERVRRRVLAHPDDEDDFTSGYTSYYVHQEVRYPRYLCYDCHRPGYWAWWNDFDPYYATCSVFDFRVNRGWSWGPAYWFGTVPYYYYAYRYDCPPRYRHFYLSHVCYSAWDGWRRWSQTWGGPLVRHKSDPPPGYVPPDRFRPRDGVPPGLLGSNFGGRNRNGVPIGQNRPSGQEGGGTRRGTVWRPAPVDRPGREVTPNPGDEGNHTRPRGDIGPRPVERPREGNGQGRPWRDTPPSRSPEQRPHEERPHPVERPREERPREESRPAERPHEERPHPVERPREERPREERPRDVERSHDNPRPEPSSGSGVRQGEWRQRGSR